MELNKEQIIKALECCKTVSELDCKTCGYKGKIGDDGAYIGCVNCLIADALALIQELTEENERLRDTAYRLESEVHRERADTVKKMQNELKKTFSALCKGEMVDLYRIIEQIAKEMLEEEG